MSRRTYTLEPQRLKPGSGYVPCEPHQACRIVVKEITAVPAKLGRRAYRITRNVEIFSGSAMMLRARALIDTKTKGTEKKPVDRGCLYRSLTSAEYDRAVAEGKATREPRWRKPAWNY